MDVCIKTITIMIATMHAVLSCAIATFNLFYELQYNQND